MTQLPALAFPLRPLTLLTGLNGAGKSRALTELLTQVPSGTRTLSVGNDRGQDDTASWLPTIAPAEVPLLLRREGEATIHRQFEAWQRAFFPALPPDPRSYWGAGRDSVRPILLFGLMAKPGDFFFVKAPELALHPRGQMLVGDFLCRVAATGVTVVFETNSDHVFNAVRLAVKNKILASDAVDTYFFSVAKEEEKLVYTRELLQINKYGRLSSWPDGFFDEWDNALDQLLTFEEAQ